MFKMFQCTLLLLSLLIIQGQKSEADNGRDIMSFSHRRQPIVAQLPKKLMGGGGTPKLFFRGKFLATD